MKKILLAMLLVVCMAASAMAFDMGKDFKIEGDVTIGYVISSSSEVSIDGAVLENSIDSGTQSKYGYMADIKLIYKDTFRPWIYFQGISGYTTDNPWALETQTFSAGMDYMFYKTNYGSAFARISYTNWQTQIDASIFNLGVSAMPESDTWMVGIGWKF